MIKSKKQNKTVALEKEQSSRTFNFDHLMRFNNLQISIHRYNIQTDNIHV